MIYWSKPSVGRAPSKACLFRFFSVWYFLLDLVQDHFGMRVFKGEPRQERVIFLGSMALLWGIGVPVALGNSGFYDSLWEEKGWETEQEIRDLACFVSASAASTLAQSMTCAIFQDSRF
jgi:hypothetical protein